MRNAMTMEEAIRNLDKCRSNIAFDTNELVIETAIDIAKDAMQKQIACAPVKTYVHGVIGAMYRCRKCNRLMKPFDRDYCDCGQKVKWDYDE